MSDKENINVTPGFFKDLVNGESVLLRFHEYNHSTKKTTGQRIVFQLSKAKNDYQLRVVESKIDKPKKKKEKKK